MGKKPENSINSVVKQDDSSRIDEPRRRLTKAGIASVPVILTLSSRPVWASQCTISGMLSGNLSNPDAEESCEGCPSHVWKKRPKDWPPQYDPGTCDKDNDKDSSPPYEGHGEGHGSSSSSSGGHSSRNYQDKDHSGDHSYSRYDNNPQSCYASDGSCKRYNGDGTRFHDVFTGDNRYGDHTMMQVMHKADSDHRFRLGAEACSALLNAESGMNYGYTPRQVVELYNEYCQTEPEALKNTCETLNNRLCPIS